MKLLLQDKRLLREFLLRGHKAHTMDYYLIIIIFKLYILAYLFLPVLAGTPLL